MDEEYYYLEKKKITREEYNKKIWANGARAVLICQKYRRILKEFEEAGDNLQDVDAKAEYLKAYNKGNWSVCWKIIMDSFNLERANFED